METVSDAQGNARPSQNEPQIAQALQDAALIASRASDLADRAERTANRLEFGADTMPQPPTPPEVVPDFGPGLVGSFARHHSTAQKHLERLAVALERMDSII